MSWRGPVLMSVAFAALAVGPGRPGRNPDFALAEQSALRGQVDQAEAIYRRVLASEPENPRALHGLAELLAQRGLCAEAAAAFDPIRSHRVFKAEAFLAEGDCALRIGDHAGAAERFEEAVKLSPRRTRGWVQLAVAREGMGDPEGAQEALQALDLVDRNQVDADYLRARLALGTPGFDLEVSAIGRAETNGEAGRMRVLARLLEAQADLLAGAPEAAARTLEEAARLDPRYTPTLVLRAEAIRRQGSAAGAELMLQRAGAAGMGSLQIAVRARVAVDLGDFEAADALLDVHPNRVDPERVASAWYLARARGADVASLRSLYDLVRLPRNGDLELLIPLESP